MKIVRGKVVADVSPNEDGSFWVETGRSSAVRVAYTSPSYNCNNGGIFAPPTPESYVLLYEDDTPVDGNPNYYYIATIVDDQPMSGDKRIPEFKAIRAGGDGSAFDKDKRPVKMTLQNGDGQGISTISDLSNSKRTNHVSLDAETGAYISAGEQGCQVVNEHTDGIIVQGQAAGTGYPYRSITMSTAGPIFNEAGSSYNITVGQLGDDISISNVANPYLLGGGGLTAGNVRIHSKHKDITLRTGAPGAPPSSQSTRNVNIIVPGAEIQVNGTTGGIVVRSLGAGGITFESTTTLDLNAPSIALNGVVSMAGGVMSVDPAAGAIAINAATQLDLFSAGTVNITGNTVGVNGAAVSILGTAPPVVGFPGAPTGPPSFVPYANAAPAITPPFMLPLPAVPSLVVPNSYGDTPLV